MLELETSRAGEWDRGSSHSGSGSQGRDSDSQHRGRALSKSSGTSQAELQARRSNERTASHGSASSAGGAGASSSSHGREELAVGDIVEYLSGTTGKWIPAEVKHVGTDGTYDLDCKPGVDISKVRRRELKRQEYPEGTLVEYQSSTTGNWIRAKVTGFSPLHGTYSLDCKPGNVKPEKLRPRQAESAFQSGGPLLDPIQETSDIEEGRGSDTNQEESDEDGYPGSAHGGYPGSAGGSGSAASRTGSKMSSGSPGRGRAGTMAAPHDEEGSSSSHGGRGRAGTMAPNLADLVSTGMGEGRLGSHGRARAGTMAVQEQSDEDDEVSLGSHGRARAGTMAAGHHDDEGSVSSHGRASSNRSAGRARAGTMAAHHHDEAGSSHSHGRSRIDTVQETADDEDEELQRTILRSREEALFPPRENTGSSQSAASAPSRFGSVMRSLLGGGGRESREVREPLPMSRFGSAPPGGNSLGHPNNNNNNNDDARSVASSSGGASRGGQSRAASHTGSFHHPQPRGSGSHEPSPHHHHQAQGHQQEHHRPNSESGPAAGQPASSSSSRSFYSPPQLLPYAQSSPRSMTIGASSYNNPLPHGLLRRPRPAELPAQEAPVQLISVSRVGDSWRFEAKEEALKLLESYGQRPVSVCSVCGPARAGKSFLLNLLVGRTQGGHVSGQFAVGSTSEPCTNGLWLWGTGASGVLFLDCEGFGSTDSDRSRDVRLMSLCMLISSVFVLNTKGVLNESLFKMASLVTHAAENLESQTATMNSNVSVGSPGGASPNFPEEVDRPALLWLLRDFVLDLTDEEGHTMTPDEYLETTLRTRPRGNNNADAGATKEVKETLMRSFPRRGCSTLVQPATEESVLERLADVPYEDLRTEFRRGLEALQARILSLTLGSGKVVGGQPLGGLALAKLLRRLVESMNSHSSGLISLGSAWDDVQYHGCEALSLELEEKIKDTFRAWADGSPLPPPCGLPMPVRDDMLARVMSDFKRRVLEDWHQRAIGSVAVQEEYLQEIHTLLDEGEVELERLNVVFAEDQLMEATDQWKVWLTQEQDASTQDVRSETLPKLLDRGLPALPVARAAREAVHLARVERIKWDGRLRALQAELRLTTADLASKTEAVNASRRLDDATLEQTREIGRLLGQVEALQSQAREAIHREKQLRDQALEAEENSRKVQREHHEALRKCEDLEASVRRYQDQVNQMKELDRIRREELAAEEIRRQARGGQPKCGCTMM